MTQSARNDAEEPHLRTLILCGGKGTRAYPHTIDLPKPLMPVGEQPILWWVMSIFARQGLTSFVLAGGHHLEKIVEFASSCPESWTVDVVDTGLDSGTGARIRRCLPVLGERFFVTYGDGLGNVSLGALTDFHRSHQGSATVSVVPLPSPYGLIDFDDRARVMGFTEKPRLHDHWINAGFFLFERSAFDDVEGDDLEAQVLPGLAKRGSLYAFEHHGFWRSMDTYKDALEITALVDGENSPWLT